MSRFYSHLNSAVQIVNEYEGKEPFASFIKKYFTQYKKYGSKDRKVISHLCYCYFRVANAVKNEPAEEAVLIGLFLCSFERNDIMDYFRPEWNEKIHLSVEEKCSMFNFQCSPKESAGWRTILKLFPFTDELSDGIEQEKFILSHLHQPDLFIRLRPGYEKVVREKLHNEGITFNEVSDTCLALPNSSKIDKIIELNKEAVVQDYSSQRTAELLFNLKSKIKNLKLRVWDCCAASGGKSIMLYDLHPDIDLTVS
ncbi:MAG TPA: Fmu (Sun) domain-containing protein, partial [Chitinophagaceae bacterium]|nr:Fmu (Sun) domain-containing protein [Chitinophagaceae bacterium]